MFRFIFGFSKNSLGKVLTHTSYGDEPTISCFPEHWVLRSLSVYYGSIKREPKIRGINKCRCDERLQTNLNKGIYAPPIHWVYYESLVGRGTVF
jgi:hypothetical protein